MLRESGLEVAEKGKMLESAKEVHVWIISKNTLFSIAEIACGSNFVSGI